MASIAPTPQIAVLLPCYQARGDVERALASVLDTPGVEVLLAPDDGSDDYADLALRFAGVVQVLPSQQRSGPGAARNRAFAASRAPFVTMLDADDFYAPGALAQALALAQGSACGIAFLRTVYVNADGQACRALAPQALLDMAAFTAFHGSIHAVYARRHWHPYGSHYSEDVLHDAELLLVAGGQAPLSPLPYCLQLRATGLSAGTPQEAKNQAYRTIRDAAPDPRIRALYQAKLDMGERFAVADPASQAAGFHHFVQSQAAGG